MLRLNEFPISDRDREGISAYRKKEIYSLLVTITTSGKDIWREAYFYGEEYDKNISDKRQTPAKNNEKCLSRISYYCLDFSRHESNIFWNLKSIQIRPKIANPNQHEWTDLLKYYYFTLCRF